MSFISRTILAFNALACFFSALAYCAPLVSPAKVWWLEYFGLGSLPLIFVHLLFIVYWSLKTPKYLLVSLICLAAGYPFNKKIIQLNLQKTPTAQAKTLKIMSLNVGLFSYPSWGRHERDQQEILDFCKLHQPDVVCFQEFQANNAGMGDINDKLLKEVFKAGYFARTINHNGVVYTGLAIFSKYPIVGKGLHKFTEMQTTNACMYADIKVRNDTIRVFGIHLQSLRFQADDFNTIKNLEEGKNAFKNTSGIKNIFKKIKNSVQKRAAQAELVAKKIAQSPHNVIVCGDFNDPPNSYAYHTVSHKLQDSFVERGSGIGYTYAGPLPFLRIDYILASPKFEVLSHHRHKADFSDHYPIIAEIQLKP